MKINKLTKLAIIFILNFAQFLLFSSIYFSNNIIIKYAINPFNICEKEPVLWLGVKMLFAASYLIVSILLTGKLEKVIEKKRRKNGKKIGMANSLTDDSLSVLIGKCGEERIVIPEKGLYQNMLVTGTIGSGKTSSAMYPITEQLIKWNALDDSKKIGMLVLDVKGNYYSQVCKYAEKFNRMDDVVVIEINGKHTYNPLDKPSIMSSVLANRLKIIMELFSGNTSESYWVDKSEQILNEAIKLCRMYNDGYVSFDELHHLIISKEYFEEKKKLLQEKYIKNELTQSQKYDLYSALSFFENEFFSLDQRSMVLLKSQITRITGNFVSDYNVLKTFSPSRENSSFSGIRDIIENGKIVVLNMNIAEYKNMSKIIATYLKLDFQAEVLARLSNMKDNGRTVAFISDEYHEYVTETDADFYAQSREAKCINVVATQSYKSLLKTLNSEPALNVIVQNLINKIWFRTDDIYTIEEAQKQIGKEEKEKISKSISENARETKFSYVRNGFKSSDSNISESINSSFEKDFIFDSNFFTQNLETFTAVAFLSDGNTIMKPKKIELIPYFKKGCD